jgi:hypothetical protein
MHCGYAAIPHSFILLGWWIVAGLPVGSTLNDCADCADLLGAAANRLVELNLKGYLCVAELARALTLSLLEHIACFSKVKQHTMIANAEIKIMNYWAKHGTHV